ncbi:unnamed protein product [Symbiodinium natans]|uniref:Ubiquitin-like domain-containing protein n=1 Tax=Symbiodinium natans TaxID=878477 RepID=A0A812R4L2_9DINO|nr:unnamed protein product [Symbiodinium natans]
MYATLSEEVHGKNENHWVQVRGVSGHELLHIQLGAQTTVADLKQELCLIFHVPAEQQQLALSRQLLQDDGQLLGELAEVLKAEVELYGMLASDLQNTAQKTEPLSSLEFVLFVASGFYDVRVPEELASPGFLLPKLSFSFPQLPLAQRIFVESVEPGSWASAAGVSQGDEVVALAGRRVASLARGEFSVLLEKTLHANGVIQFYKGGLKSYFCDSCSDGEASGSLETGSAGSVLCLFADMDDRELLAMRLPTGSRICELKQHLQRLLKIPDSCLQLLFENKPLEDDVVLGGFGQGTRFAVLRIALFTQEEFGGALKSDLQLELGLAFGDPAFLPAGRIAIAAVDSEKWADMLEFLGNDDLETPSDGQVVAVLPRNDFNALVSRGPLNFLFHSADVPRALPADFQEAEVREAALPDSGASGASGPSAEAHAIEPETPVSTLRCTSFTPKPRPKPKATG